MSKSYYLSLVADLLAKLDIQSSLFRYCGSDLIFRILVQMYHFAYLDLDPVPKENNMEET